MSGQPTKAPSPEALAIAREILTDLSDRAGIPEWLGRFDRPDTRHVAREIAEIIDRRVAHAASLRSSETREEFAAIDDFFSWLGGQRPTLVEWLRAGVARHKLEELLGLHATSRADRLTMTRDPKEKKTP